jgi:hypothetical protein
LAPAWRIEFSHLAQEGETGKGKESKAKKSIDEKNGGIAPPFFCLASSDCIKHC